MSIKAISVIVNFLVYLCVPIAVGWLSGWLVGASQTPVISTVIPLIFGLMTAIGFGFVGIILRKSAIADAIKSVDLSPEIREKIESGIGIMPTPDAMMFGAIGAIVFCIAFYSGIHQGMSLRRPAYPSIKQSYANLDFAPEEAVVLHKVRLDLMGLGVTEQEYSAIVNDVYIPILNKERNELGTAEQRLTRVKELRDATEVLIGKYLLPLDGQKQEADVQKVGPAELSPSAPPAETAT